MRALPLKTLAVTLAAGLALAACATATPYQPAGLNGQRGGYAEQRLENNRFRVSFSGNSVTSRDQVEMSLLLRSARTDGRERLRLVRHRQPRHRPRHPLRLDAGSVLLALQQLLWPLLGSVVALLPQRILEPVGSLGANDFDVRQVDRYEANAEIIMGRGPKPANDPNAFDAREVVQNLSARVTRPGA